MSRSGRIELNWGDGKGDGKDGKHVFRLTISKLEELQDLCNAGPQRIFERLAGSDWFAQDIRDTIRLGLLGGGMASDRVNKLIERYVSDGMLLENKVAARQVLMAAMHCEEEDPRPKANGAKTTTEPSDQMTTADDSSTSPRSTDAGPTSDLTPPRSDNSVSGN